MISRNQEMPSEVKELSFDGEIIDKMIKFMYLPLREKFSEKKVHFKVLVTNGKTNETLSERTLDLTNYFKRGMVRENVRMDGKVKFFVVDIMVETQEEAMTRTGGKLSLEEMDALSSDDDAP